MARSRATLTAVLAAGVLGLAGCGQDDDDAPATEAATPPTTETATAPAPEPAPLGDDGTFAANDVADCLLEAGVGAAVSLDGAALELHDAMAQVIVEQGNGDILVYGSEDAASAQEQRYRDSFGDLSEVERVRNLLVQYDPELPEDVRSQIGGCLGAR